MGRRSRSDPRGDRGSGTGQRTPPPRKATSELLLDATLSGVSRPPLAAKAIVPAPVNVRVGGKLAPVPAQPADARVQQMPQAVADTLAAANQPDAAADPARAATLAGMPGQPVVSVASFPVPDWERYEFLGVLGRGGMGAVYRARDRRLKREVALKFA